MRKQDTLGVVEHIVDDMLRQNIRPRLKTLNPVVASLYNSGNKSRAVKLLKSTLTESTDDATVSSHDFPRRLTALVGVCSWQTVYWSRVKELLEFSASEYHQNLIASVLVQSVVAYFFAEGKLGAPLNAMTPIPGLAARVVKKAVSMIWCHGDFQPHKALALIHELHRKNIMEKRTWQRLCMLTAHLSFSSERAHVLSEAMERYFVTLTTPDYNYLVRAHCIVANEPRAMLILAKMLERSSIDPGVRPDATTFAQLITMLAKLGKFDKAMELFNLMSAVTGMPPPASFYNFILRPTTAASLWYQFTRDKVAPTPRLLSNFVWNLCQASLAAEAVEVWALAYHHKMVLSLQAMFTLLSTLRGMKQYQQALEIFDQAAPLALSQPKETRSWPNHHTLTGVIRTALQLGDKERAKNYWEMLRDPTTFDIAPHIDGYAAAIELCKQLNDVELAFRLLDEVLDRQRVQPGFINYRFTNQFVRVLPNSGIDRATVNSAFDWLFSLHAPRELSMSEEHMAEFKAKIAQWQASRSPQPIAPL
jgi:pentatricopeptide repeat protein